MTRPQFRVRDYLWVVVVWALAMGWWLDHARTLGMRQSFIEVDRKARELEEQLRYQQSREEHLLESIVDDLKPNNFELIHTVKVWELQDRSVPSS